MELSESESKSEINLFPIQFQSTFPNTNALLLHICNYAEQQQKVLKIRGKWHWSKKYLKLQIKIIPCKHKHYFISLTLWCCNSWHNVQGNYSKYGEMEKEIPGDLSSNNGSLSGTFSSLRLRREARSSNQTDGLSGNRVWSFFNTVSSCISSIYKINSIAF